MSSRWDSGIIVWSAGNLQVLKEGKDGVYVVDPTQKGCPVVFRFHDIMFAEHYQGTVGVRRKSRVPRAMLGAAIGGMPGALWLGLSGGSGRWYLRIRENGSTTRRIFQCRNRFDAMRMERRIMKRHAHRRQPGEQPPAPQPAKPSKRNAPPQPPAGYAGGNGDALGGNA